jgi:hypothetical protein
MRRALAVIASIVALVGAAPLGAQPLDSTATEALAATLKMLLDPAQRGAAIAANPQAAPIDQHIRALTGSDALTQEFYALAAEVFQELAVGTGGDVAKMTEALGRARSDPSGFAALLSPQTQQRLRQLSTKISDQRR